MPSFLADFEESLRRDAQCCEYLKHTNLPTARQSSESVDRLLDQLEAYTLTKAERLQIVNLAPKSLVELVVVSGQQLLSRGALADAPLLANSLQCVEDLEERFPDSTTQEEILALVASHLGEVKADEGLGVATMARNGYAATAGQDDAAYDDDVDDAEQAELEDIEGLIDDGTGDGAMEDMGRELDEAAEDHDS